MSPSSPSSIPRGSAAALAILFVALAGSARAEARLDITGSVLSTTEEEIRVRVGLTNPGPEAVRDVVVRGELFGAGAEAKVAGELAVHATSDAVLTFPTDNATPGVHAVTLLLEYASGAGAGATTFTQPAWVLVALGGQAEPAVRLFAEEARLDVVGGLEVGVESADGAPHHVTLSVVTPRSLRARPAETGVEVPARGRVSVPIRLFRVDAPWQSRQGLLVVAVDSAGPLARTTVIPGSAQVGRAPGWLPGLRKVLIGIAFVLMAVAAFFEMKKRRPESGAM